MKVSHIQHTEHSINYILSTVKYLCEETVTLTAAKIRIRRHYWCYPAVYKERK